MKDTVRPTPDQRRAPKWLKLLNRFNQALLARGIGRREQHMLTIPGRTSGLPRATPVAIVDFDGGRYIVAGYAGADWVKNARHAGTAELHRGGHREAVLLDEVPVDQRSPILREFARQVPGGRPFLKVATKASDDAYAKASPHHPVFRVKSGHSGNS